MIRTGNIASHQAVSLQTAAKCLLPVLAKITMHSIEPVWLVGSYLRAALAGLHNQPNSDIDLVFFNDRETSRQYEKEIEAALQEHTGFSNISVKNQARITVDTDGKRYADVFQSIEGFPDVTVSVAARASIFEQPIVTFFTPYGLSWISEKTVRPTASYLSKHCVGSFCSWIYRKQYSQTLPDWNIEIAPGTPLTSDKLCHFRSDPSSLTYKRGYSASLR